MTVFKRVLLFSGVCSLITYLMVVLGYNFPSWLMKRDVDLRFFIPIAIISVGAVLLIEWRLRCFRLSREHFVFTVLAGFFLHWVLFQVMYKIDKAVWYAYLAQSPSHVDDYYGPFRFVFLPNEYMLVTSAVVFLASSMILCICYSRVPKTV